MGSISQYGVLGAFVGLVFGILDYILLDRLLYPRLRESYELAKTTQTHRVEPNVVMGVLKIACFTIFPVIGYILADELAKSGF